MKDPDTSYLHADRNLARSPENLRPGAHAHDWHQPADFEPLDTSYLHPERHVDALDLAQRLARPPA